MIINNKFNYKKTINVSRGTLVINKIKYYYFILYFFNFLMFHVEHRGEYIMMDVDKLEVAFEQAKIAYNLDEIPVGCAIFRGDELIACGYNEKEEKNDAIRHAELVAISRACRKLGSWRLDDCSLYVTLEPCMMCIGAIMESRIKNIYYGTIRQGVQMYNKTTVEPYVSLNYIKSYKCSEILSDFFKKKRKK